ncbi:MAG: helix-turn-helix transcriptional regulator [Patescibacteria group bacterium]
MASPKYKPSLPRTEVDQQRKQFTHKLAIHLRSLRDDKGFTQEELAFKAGINTAYYSHLERGVYSPTMFIMWRIAQALGIKLEELMRGYE